MYFKQFVGKGYGKYWRGIIFDREYKNLGDLVAKAERWFPQFKDGAKFRQSKGDYRWTWPTGEELLFRAIKKESDYNNYHGHEYPFIGWNELTKYPTSKLYDLMLSCNRTSFVPSEHSPDLVNPLPEIPLRIFSTTNPYGPGHNWVKLRFIDVAGAGKILKLKREVFDPRTQQKIIVEKSQVRIFGSYLENRFLPALYIAGLFDEKDEARRKAWTLGDWDIVAGGALDDVWQRSLHVLARFKIPAYWRVKRAFDWGSSHPYAVIWYCECNGEELRDDRNKPVLIKGKPFCPPKGTLIIFAEWYGTKEIGTNEGTKLSAREIALGIKVREVALRDASWIYNKPSPGPADNQIRNVNDSETDSIAKIMEKNGVYWEDSDKAPGSRKVGLQLLRDRLDAAKKGVGPGLYVMDNCTAWLSTVPSLPRDTDDLDDVDTEAEDHLYDATRYAALDSSGRSAKPLKSSFPT